MSEEAQEVAVETEVAAETVTEETPAAEAPVEEKRPRTLRIRHSFCCYSKKRGCATGCS